MSTQATAIYEGGVLRLLTPVSLPERARVRIQILNEDELEDDMRRAEAALIAAGLVKPPKHRLSSRPFLRPAAWNWPACTRQGDHCPKPPSPSVNAR